jgi:hypothetical protein
VCGTGAGGEAFTRGETHYPAEGHGFVKGRSIADADEVYVEFRVRGGRGLDQIDHFVACVKHVQGLEEVEFPLWQGVDVIAEGRTDRCGGLGYEDGEVVLNGPFIVGFGNDRDG